MREAFLKAKGGSKIRDFVHSDILDSPKKREDFFASVKLIADILRPIKESLKIIEGGNASLADFHFQLVALGITINKLPLTIDTLIRTHIIDAFNSRYAEFVPNDAAYSLLAYYFHPRYRSRGVTAVGRRLVLKAIFQLQLDHNYDLEKTMALTHGELLAFDKRVAPFNHHFNMDKQSAWDWWYISEERGGEMQGFLRFACLRVFAARANAVACESVFSETGFINNKYRARMNITSIEDTLLVRRYCRANLSKGLKTFMMKGIETVLKDADASLKEMIEVEQAQEEEMYELTEEDGIELASAVPATQYNIPSPVSEQFLATYELEFDPYKMELRNFAANMAEGTDREEHSEFRVPSQGRGLTAAQALAALDG